MAVILVLLAILAAAFGLMFLSEATTGVGILAIACFLGILARIAQADGQHKELKKLIGEGNKTTSPQATTTQAPVQSS